MNIYWYWFFIVIPSRSGKYTTITAVSTDSTVSQVLASLMAMYLFSSKDLDQAMCNFLEIALSLTRLPLSLDQV